MDPAADAMEKLEFERGDVGGPDAHKRSAGPGAVEQEKRKERNGRQEPNQRQFHSVILHGGKGRGKVGAGLDLIEIVSDGAADRERSIEAEPP